MRQHFRMMMWLLAAGGTVACGSLLPRFFGGAMPQVPGEDVLHLVLGDARQELSAALLVKADEYFHGGVSDVACEHGMTSSDVQARDHHEHDPSHGEPCREKAHGDEAARGRDPWEWINGRVHVQEHRHLRDDQAAELLPWIWAACRASPQNVQAYQTGAYVLARMTGHSEQGVRLLEEGYRRNPRDAGIAFSLGEMWLTRLHDAARAEPWFAAARSLCRPAEGAAGESDRILRVRTLFYLGYLAKQRGDLARARACLAEAETVFPGHASVSDLKRVLQE